MLLPSSKCWLFPITACLYLQANAFKLIANFSFVLCSEFIVIICRNFNLLGSYCANPKWHPYPTGFRKLAWRAVLESIDTKVLCHSKGLPLGLFLVLFYFNKVVPISFLNWNPSPPPCNPLSLLILDFVPAAVQGLQDPLAWLLGNAIATSFSFPWSP